MEFLFLNINFKGLLVFFVSLWKLLLFLFVSFFRLIYYVFNPRRPTLVLLFLILESLNIFLYSCLLLFIYITLMFLPSSSALVVYTLCVCNMYIMQHYVLFHEQVVGTAGTTLQRNITIYVLVAGIAGGLLLILSILLLCKYCSRSRSRSTGSHIASSVIRYTQYINYIYYLVEYILASP